MKTERYNVNKSFEDNKKEGPYGYQDIEDKNIEINKLIVNSKKEYDFFGYKTKLPLGVAAGSLFNEKYMKAAAKDGFNVITWKTFRSEFRLAHKNNGNFLGHNIVFLHNNTALTKEDIGKQVVADLNFPKDRNMLSITNSFGMGSDSPDVWSKEVQKIEDWMIENSKQTIASVVGSPKSDWTTQMLADDYANVAKIAQDSGSKIIELNFSCPNVGNNSCGKEGSIYSSPVDAKIICETVRNNLNPNTKLIIKIGYSSKENYRELINSVKDFIDGIVAINTIPMQVLDSNGKQALPGGLISGTCGSNILDLAVEAVKNLAEIKKEDGLDLMIIGCGGVVNPKGFFRHIDAGAEFVMVATAALFNPELPLQVAKEISKNIN